MKKLFLCFLLFTTIQARAECREVYFDKNGKELTTPCFTKKQEVKCAHQLAYWNGRACVKLQGMSQCQSQGGTWYAREMPPLCVCPQQQVWDGNRCRSDIPLAQQCEIFPGLPVARKFAISTKSKCVNVSPENTCRRQDGYWVSDTRPPFCICPQQQVWDGESCRSNIPLAQHFALEKTKKNLEKLIETFKKADIPVLLVGMEVPLTEKPEYREGIRQMYADLALENELLLYPFFMDGLWKEDGTNADASYFLADKMHPSAKGVAIMVRRILPAVEQFLREDVQATENK